jgi:kinesin family protein 1
MVQSCLFFSVQTQCFTDNILERVRDLLNPTTKGNLKVREHPSTGPYVEDLAKLVVGTFAEIENLMDEGNKARTVAATNMNETSSRSHAVFTLILTQRRHDTETNMDTEKVSRISLVDLAGSERATSTGATGARLKEGAEINRSLSTLGRVIAALADLSQGKTAGGKKKATQVPYRDSVLTWLLKDSLGGNSMTAMIAAISPADINFDETLSTLRYADSAKRIKNHAVVNEDPNARMIRELKEELMQLRSKLSGGGGGVEEYSADVPPEKQIVTITAPNGEIKKVSKAEIAEQLHQSEKILTDLNQTWEERLEKTQQIHKERESALEELGISIEKGFIGLSTPKRMPHLVNLSDDPLLAECLVYNIKPGTTQVGNVETSPTAQIRLNGSKILQDHCRFENDNGVVTLVPNEGAAVMVNGLRIEKPRRLRTGFRIILGDFHIFRFNHPQEARAERDRLRQSATINSASLPQTPDHRHTTSNGVSDILEKIDSESVTSRPESPAAVPNSRDMEWSFARREAATAWLGDSSKINTLTDDELDNLLEEMQRVKAIRKGRPDSRIDDDETESVSSFFPGVREKYASTATLADDLSLDTMITMPGTPQQGEVEERLRLMKEEMQCQLEQQKEEYQEKLRAAEESNVEIEEIKSEKLRMQEQLDTARAEMQKELKKQRQEFESRLEEISLAPSKRPNSGKRRLTDKQRSLAKDVINHWRQRKYVRMAESILQHAAILKEAQIMSNEMEKSVVFQFTIVDEGHTFQSSYDLVLNGISAEDDESLEMAKKPCVGVRIMDFHACVVHLWSLEKLQNRVRQMRQIYQYLDRPEYLQVRICFFPFFSFPFFDVTIGVWSTALTELARCGSISD